MSPDWDCLWRELQLGWGSERISSKLLLLIYYRLTKWSILAVILQLLWLCVFAYPARRECDEIMADCHDYSAVAAASRANHQWQLKTVVSASARHTCIYMYIRCTCYVTNIYLLYFYTSTIFIIKWCFTFVCYQFNYDLPFRCVCTQLTLRYNAF